MKSVKIASLASAFVAVTFLALSAAALEPASDKEPGTEPLPLNRCFCIQFTDGMPPYYLGKLIPPAPGCAEMRYQGNDKSPWENGLLACEELQKCFNGSAEYAEKKKILNDKTLQAEKNLGECCPRSKEGAATAPPCSNKCSSDWQGILKVLSTETEKLEKAQLPAREFCIVKSEKDKKKIERKKGASN